MSHGSTSTRKIYTDELYEDIVNIIYLTPRKGDLFSVSPPVGDIYF